MVEKLRNQKIDAPFEVLEENWESVAVFLACASQWNYAPSGHVTGINYQALHSVCKMLGVKDERDTFLGVQTMEFAALAVIRKRGSNGV